MHNIDRTTIMMMIPNWKREIYVNESKLRRIALVLKMLNRDGKLESSLIDKGLSIDELNELVQVLDFDYLSNQTFPWDNADQGSTNRIFNSWEKTFLTNEAQMLLLAALYSNAISTNELESVLSLAQMQPNGYFDVESICALLETIISDRETASLFSVFLDTH